MKTKTLHLGLIALIVGAFFGLSSLSNASLINITINPSTGQPATDIDFGLLGNNSVQINFDALATDIAAYNSFFGTSLPAPLSTGSADLSPGTVDITGFDYAVLHYGKGRHGAGQGGGIVFYDLNGMTGLFTFPANGSEPNGFGGLSSIRLFVGAPATVPDGGTTVALLGIALSGVGIARRYIKR